MFTRATSRSYTCLKCQYRLASRESARIESQNITTRVPRRWQTSAASAAVKDEYDKDVSGDHAEEEEPKYSIRRWRTANIGGDVLGKPAEILLLPDSKKRGKKILRDVDVGAGGDVAGQEASKETKDKPQLRIHEALAQESRPTSRRDVVGNIEKIREEAWVNVKDGSLTQEKYMECFRGLSRGFTKRQLTWYLEDNISVLKSLSSDGNVHVQGRNRSQAATDILSKIWGFPNKVPPKDLSGYMSGSVNLGRGRRELILGVDREWRRFLQHITVEPSSTPGWIDIAGPESWVTKAESVFGSLKRRVCSQTIVLPSIYAKALEEQYHDAGKKARSILQELMQEYEITMTKRSEWTAFAFKMDRITRFERALILAQPKLPTGSEDKSTSLILSSVPVDMDSVMPVYTSTPASDPHGWYRYALPKVSSNESATPRITDPEHEAFRNLTTALKSQLFDKDVSTLNYSFSHESPSAVGNVTTEYSATIGQALHKDQADDLDVNTDTPKTDFATTIPLLRQFLAKQEAYRPSDDPAVASDSLALRFIPSDTQISPKIELIATVTSSRPKAIDVVIESVKLVFSSDSAHVAIPIAPTDLKLTRLTCVPIFQRQDGSPVQEIYAPMLGQIAYQIRNRDEMEEDSSRLHLNKTIQLDLGFLGTAGTAKGKEKSTSAVRYALDKAELIDKRIYRVSGQDKIMLEHTSYLPLKISSSTESSELLRVIPGEKASTLASGEDFMDFVKGAVGVVEMLEGFVAEKTREMVQEKNGQGEVKGGEKEKE